MLINHLSRSFRSPQPALNHFKPSARLLIGPSNLTPFKPFKSPLLTSSCLFSQSLLSRSFAKKPISHNPPSSKKTSEAPPKDSEFLRQKFWLSQAKERRIEIDKFVQNRPTQKGEFYMLQFTSFVSIAGFWGFLVTSNPAFLSLGGAPLLFYSSDYWYAILACQDTQNEDPSKIPPERKELGLMALGLGLSPLILPFIGISYQWVCLWYCFILMANFGIRAFHFSEKTLLKHVFNQRNSYRHKVETSFGILFVLLMLATKISIEAQKKVLEENSQKLEEEVFKIDDSIVSLFNED